LSNNRGVRWVFISYRRADSALPAELIHLGLKDLAFLDVCDLHGGDKFDEKILKSLSECKVVLVLIGRTWLAPASEGKGPRLFEEDDFLRLEIRTALALDKRVRIIPILVDGAAMPTAAQLPHDLRELAGRNAFEIRTGSAQRDLARLIDEQLRPWRRKVWLAAAAVFVIGAAAGVRVVWFPGPKPPVVPAVAMPKAELPPANPVAGLMAPKLSPKLVAHRSGSRDKAPAATGVLRTPPPEAAPRPVGDSCPELDAQIKRLETARKQCEYPRLVMKNDRDECAAPFDSKLRELLTKKLDCHP
jgi:hypothetical protein